AMWACRMTSCWPTQAVTDLSGGRAPSEHSRPLLQMLFSATSCLYRARSGPGWGRSAS
ncbi:unnamed protein product, partial [Symbiodinium necroappetens]